MSSEKIFGYAAYEKGGPLKPFEYEPRPLGDRDVELSIICCGICGSDIHTIDSGWGPTSYPVIVGHEIIGIVTKKGKDVPEFEIGARVGVGAQVWADLSCKNCKNGADNHCSKGVFTYNAKYTDGGVAYGGYAKAVRLSADYAFAIPEKIQSEAAAPLLCAGITVYSPLRQHNVGKGTRLGIIGIGGLGHFALQFGNALGAEVTAISMSANKEEECKKLGAHNFLLFSDAQARKKAASSLDVIICTSFGADTDWDAYINLLDFGGKFVLVGIPEKPLNIKAFSLILRRVSIVGSLIGGKEEIKDMLQFAADHDIKAIVQTFPMSECNTAVEHMRAGKARYRYVLQNVEGADVPPPKSNL